MAKSFRINEEALEALREEARSQTLSLNTLVNQLLVNYTQIGRFLKRMHAMMLSRQTLTDLIEPLSDDDIVRAGQRAGRTAPEALIVAIHGKITVSHVIDLIRNLSSYSDLYEYTEKAEGERLTVTLMHDLGHKWSLFIAHYAQEAFAAAGCKIKCDIADRYVTFTV